MQKDFIENFNLLNSAVLQAVQAPGEAEVLKIFTKISVQILNADYGFAFFKDDGSQEFELIYKDPATPFEPPLPRKSGVTNTAFDSKAPVYETDYGKSRWLIGDLGPYIKGFVAIPIAYQNNQYGTFNICYYEEHQFTTEEKTLCEFIGNSAAQAITINRLMHKEQIARQESEAQRLRFRAMIENGYDVIALLDSTGVIMDISNSAARVSGYSVRELLGVNIVDFIHPDDSGKIQDHIMQTVSQPNKALVVEARYRHNDGSWHWMEASGINKIDDPSVGGIIANIRDITERKQAESTIKEQAMRDALTGLPNRQEFAARFEQAFEQAKRHNGQLAIMFLDMDRFKNVNDRLGHKAGDILLKVVASRLSGCLRAEDAAARFGGDEFLILINEIRSSKDVMAAAEKILKAVNLPVNIGEHTLHPSVSIGIAIYPNDGLDIEGLKKNADIALYRAKESGRNRFSLYDPSLNGLYQAEKYAVENELREALLKDQITVYYQPIISLRRGKLLAVEALARWNHPKRGLLLPAEFITLAEETGLIAELDKMIFKKACLQAKIWKQMGLLKFRMAVNLSAQQFSEAQFVSGVAGVLAETGLEAGDLEMEIIESLAMDDLELTSLNLKALKKLGIHITIDDFGTGYSSLNYLKRFPIHGLKIDKSFIRHCITDASDTSITKTIIAMAQTLNLKVIAEGVEDGQQLEFLTSLGCDGAQGFFIAKPMPSEDLADWLESYYPKKTLIEANKYVEKVKLV